MLLNFCLRSWPKERLDRAYAECQWNRVYGRPGQVTSSGPAVEFMGMNERTSQEEKGG